MERTHSSISTDTDLSLSIHKGMAPGPHPYGYENRWKHKSLCEQITWRLQYLLCVLHGDALYIAVIPHCLGNGGRNKSILMSSMSGFFFSWNIFNPWLVEFVDAETPGYGQPTVLPNFSLPYFRIFLSQNSLRTL